MIKVGIYGPATVESPLRKQLLRLLLRHPDVDLRCVASPEGTLQQLSEIHPIYAGETDLRLERKVDLESLDVLFCIDEECLLPEAIAKLAEDDEFRLILLGNTPRTLDSSDSTFEYGLAEYNRKALVRGTRAAVSPRPLAMTLELALFPLAKKWLLPTLGNIRGTISCPVWNEDGSTDLKAEISEAIGLLRRVQPNFDGAEMAIEYVGEAFYERVDLALTLPLDKDIDAVIEAYQEAYEDHNFVYIVPGRGPVDEDMRGSNKCLLRIWSDGEQMRIEASMDYQTKGQAGNAVHLMNLMFGLYERTGLSI